MQIELGSPGASDTMLMATVLQRFIGGFYFPWHRDVPTFPGDVDEHAREDDLVWQVLRCVPGFRHDFL